MNGTLLCLLILLFFAVLKASQAQTYVSSDQWKSKLLLYPGRQDLIITLTDDRLNNKVEVIMPPAGLLQEVVIRLTHENEEDHDDHEHALRIEVKM